ncbi:MAG TPA: S26 family signal peptidase [Acidimicrobiales bacterium]|nr:S26 family signal peptidase [Acidimicrobiales bacterium]
MTAVSTYKLVTVLVYRFAVTRILEFFVRRVTVEGSSMAPTYLPGERLTAFRRWRRVRLGDVVVVRDPRNPSRWLLKRCVERVGSLLDLRGDNAQASTDSRDFGLVPSRDAIYIVVPTAR